MAFQVMNVTSANSSSSTAEIHSYVCRTGMGNLPVLAIEEAIQFFPQTNKTWRGYRLIICDPRCE